NAGYVLRGLNSLPSMIASCQRSCRPPARADTAGDTGFAYYRIDAEPLAALTHTAKAWGVTLNDAFLAALLKAVALMAPDRLHTVELRFPSIERQRRFYAKHYPIFAGVTTLNVNALWKAAAPERRSSLDYIRAVPTGPLAPLVFAISTSGDVANIGISFRTADVEGSTVDRVAGEFLGCIHNL